MPGTSSATFDLRYYQWALDDWRRELDDQLPFLRRLGGPITARIVRTMEGLESWERHDLAVALTVRFHPTAASALGATLSQEQVRLLDRWDAERRQPEVADASGPASRADKRSLRKGLRAALSFLGEAEATNAAGVWRYTTQQSGCTVRTHIDTAGRLFDLSYHHDLMLDSGERVRFISFLAWLGIGPSKWNLPTGDDGRDTAELVGALCRVFLAALPKLVA